MIGSSKRDGRSASSVGDGLAAADMVRNVLDVGHRPAAGRNVHGCDVEADPVPRLDINHKPGAVPHSDTDVPLLDHGFTPAFCDLAVDVWRWSRGDEPSPPSRQVGLSHCSLR